MVIRTSSATVWLNNRLVAWFQGESAHDVFARLAKHTERPCIQLAQGERKSKASKGEGMPLHPLENIARAVAWRLANPTNRAFLSREVSKAKGSNAHRTKVKNDGQLRGFTQRDLSPTDCEEVRGVIALIHADLGNPERLDLGAWKRIFSECRAVLGMKRKVNREGLLDSLDGIDFHSELTLDAALIASLEAERDAAEEMEREKRNSIARTARALRGKLRAARRADLSRRARANYRTAARYLRKAIHTALGLGHAHQLSRQQAYWENQVFTDYCQKGEIQLAKERDEERAQWQAEETARLMYAVSE